MNTETLTASALFWLLTTGKCKLVTVERGLSWGNPDALGVNEERRLTEIEVKVSYSDFKANGTKGYIQYLNKIDCDRSDMPSLYYFLAPPKLAERIKDEIPHYAGLMTVNMGRNNDNPQMWTNGAYDLSIIKRAPRMKRKKLSLNQIVRVAKHQGMAFTIEKLRTERFRERVKECSECQTRRDLAAQEFEEFKERLAIKC